jgi:hypothetical protein
MSNTTNYGWNIPDNTDLVKDGALAIRTLGSAIDTSMNTALGTRKAGMVLLNTTSFSAVASQAINGCFSSAYTNYRLVISGNMAGTALIQFRLRTSTTDDTSSNYAYAEFVSDGASSYPAQATGQNIGRLAGFVAVRSAASVDIFSPFETKTTGLITVGVRSFTNPNQYSFFSGVNTSTSYDGINLIASTGTMTGEVSVYGYNK